MINGFEVHEAGTAPGASAEILDGVQKASGFVPNLHRVLAELVLATTKLISNYTNHLAATPLDSFMQGAEWTAPGKLKLAVQHDCGGVRALTEGVAISCHLS
jgi:hypothetical protein